MFWRAALPNSHGPVLVGKEVRDLVFVWLKPTFPCQYGPALLLIPLAFLMVWDYMAKWGGQNLHGASWSLRAIMTQSLQLEHVHFPPSNS